MEDLENKVFSTGDNEFFNKLLNMEKKILEEIDPEAVEIVEKDIKKLNENIDE